MHTIKTLVIWSKFAEKNEKFKTFSEMFSSFTKTYNNAIATPVKVLYSVSSANKIPYPLCVVLYNNGG